MHDMDGYFFPSADEVWRDGIFSPDASFLTNLCGYSEEVREAIFGVLQRKADQGKLWLTHQALLEYHQSRISGVIKHMRICRAKRREISALREQCKGLAGSPREALVEPRLASDLDEAFGNVIEAMTETENDTRKLIVQDPVRDRVLAIVGNAVGVEYKEDELEKIYEEGKKRFSNEVPPGFKDDSKPERRKYGDLIIWKQLIGKAKTDQQPIVFLTDDVKADWWACLDKEPISPMPDLAQEMWREAQAKFWMYHTDGLLQDAATYGGATVSREVLDEVKEVMSERNTTITEALWQEDMDSPLPRPDLHPRVAELQADPNVDADSISLGRSGTETYVSYRRKSRGTSSDASFQRLRRLIEMLAANKTQDNT